MPANRGVPPNEILFSFVPNSRYLEITVINRENSLNRYITSDASSVSYHPGLHRDSATWNFEHDGIKYKVQVQRTDVES